MKTKLKMKCPNCGDWNRIEVDKLLVEQETAELKVKAYVPMYKPLKTETCKNCGQTITDPKELIRIVKQEKKGNASS